MSTVVALDIETESLTEDSSHALHPHLSRITCVGIWCPEFEVVFRDLIELDKFLKDNDLKFVGHNFQFDLRHLYHKGIQVPLDRWVFDTKIAAGLSNDKITDEWLEEYETKRKIKNKELEIGHRYRPGSKHSLKTLAPYFLGVDPFWEVGNKDNDEYVLKDCEYTYKLYTKLDQTLEKEGNSEFYYNRSHNWAKMLLQASLRGVQIDPHILGDMEVKAEKEAEDLKTKLDSIWSPAYTHFYKQKCKEVKDKYNQMRIRAVEKGKDPKKAEDYYKRLCDNALEKVEFNMNLDSPLQLQELLGSYFNYDITDFKGKVSTGAEVLQRLAEKHEDVRLLYDYRKKKKLLTSFFPTYKQLQDNWVLRPSFNINGTRTGRISVSDPNLNQVPGGLHCLFKAREGYKLITKDESAIEPRIAAYLTEDERLCELMISGGDFHSTNAVIMFGLNCDASEVKEKHPYERKVAKEVGLALLYGAGAKRIKESAIKYGFNWDIKKCRQIHRRFKNTYKTAFQFKESLDARAKQLKPVRNPFGRVHYYFDEDEVHMKTFNTLIQSAASDLVLDAMYKTLQKCEELGLECHPVLSIYDEIVLEAPIEIVDKVENILDTCMVDYQLTTKHGTIPLEIEGQIAEVWTK